MCQLLLGVSLLSASTHPSNSPLHSNTLHSDLSWFCPFSTRCSSRLAPITHNYPNYKWLQTQRRWRCPCVTLTARQAMSRPPRPRTPTRGERRRTEESEKATVSCQGDGKLEEQMENPRATSVNVNVRTLICVDGAYSLAPFSSRSGGKNRE